MARKKTPPAAAAITISEPCERDAEGYGALTFVRHDGYIVTQPELSALKAQLLAAGFESDEISLSEWLVEHGDEEVRERWDEASDLQGWNPEPIGEAWTLCAVLCLLDDNGNTVDAVALFARPPGADMAADQPRAAAEEDHAPETGAESAPQPVASEPMTKAEAHLGRKSAQFELLEPTDALLKSFTPRVERHGEDNVSAASLGLRIEASNTILDLLSPSLRRTLYAAPEGQEPLPGVEESTPLLRTKVIETLKLNNCYEGWTLRIYAGFDEDEPFVIGDAKVDKFVLTPRDGGSVQLDLRIGSSDIDEAEAGWLYGHQRQDIEITLHAPVMKSGAIDGTQAAFERDHPAGGDEPDAGDLFAEAHGDDDFDGSEDEFDDADADHEEEEPA